MAGNYQLWIQHFIDQSKGLIPHQKLFYKIGANSQSGEGKPSIQVVSPTEQVVARAKSSLEDRNKHSYDPVTGVFRQSLTNLLGEHKQRKRRKTKKLKLTRAKKVTKKVSKKKKRITAKRTSLKKSLKNKSKKVLESWLL